jgi:hypothetical protein
VFHAERQASLPFQRSRDICTVVATKSTCRADDRPRAAPAVFGAAAAHAHARGPPPSVSKLQAPEGGRPARALRQPWHHEDQTGNGSPWTRTARAGGAAAGCRHCLVRAAESYATGRPAAAPGMQVPRRTGRGGFAAAQVPFRGCCGCPAERGGYQHGRVESFTGRVCLSDTYLGRQWLLSQQHANTFRRLYWSVRKHRARSCRSFILSKSRSSNWKPLQKANQTIKAFVTHPALRSIWREAACNPRLIWKQQLSYSQNVVVLAPSILMRRPYNTLHLFVRSQGGDKTFDTYRQLQLRRTSHDNDQPAEKCECLNTCLAACLPLSSKSTGCGDVTAPCSARRTTRARDQCQCSEAARKIQDQEPRQFRAKTPLTALCFNQIYNSIIIWRKIANFWNVLLFSWQVISVNANSLTR